MKKNRGFTLIEILLVIAIIAILSVIAFLSYSSVQMRSRDAKRKADLEQVRSALEMFRTDTGSYPEATNGFDLFPNQLPMLVPTYMPSIPTDPKDTFNYYYSPLAGSGTPTKYYGYCICADLENQTGIVSTCPDSVRTTDPTACNYYLVNP